MMDGERHWGRWGPVGDGGRRWGTVGDDGAAGAVGVSAVTAPPVGFAKTSDVYGAFSNFYGQPRGQHNDVDVTFRVPALEGTFMRRDRWDFIERAFICVKLLVGGQRAAAVALATAPEQWAKQAKLMGRPPQLILDAAQIRVWQQTSVVVMDHLLHCKFAHGSPQLRELLLSTGEADIEEQTDDSFWGTGKWNSSGRGANHLGKGLVRTRTLIREGVPPSPLPPQVMSLLTDD